MTTTSTSFLISAISAGIALFALGWNVYRDIIIKPKVKVRFRIDMIAEEGDDPSSRETVICFHATNHGPGAVVLQGIGIKTHVFLRKTKWSILLHDFHHPISSRFPSKLEVGELNHYVLPYRKDIFLKEDFGKIGIYDSFGKYHWAPKTDIKDAKKQYKQDFDTN